MCPDATTGQWQCILLAPIRQPAICTGKEGSGALRSSQVKLTGLSLQALWGGSHQCSSLLAAGPQPHHSQGCPAPPGTRQSQGNTPRDVSCPQLETAKRGAHKSAQAGEAHAPHLLVKEKPRPRKRNRQVDRQGEREGRGRKSHLETITCSSHRKTSKASRRTACKVQSHLRIREIKQALKKIWGTV